MTVIERTAIVPDVPKEIVFYMLELVGETLVDDSKEYYGDVPGYYAEMKVEELSHKPWNVDYVLKFNVFHYHFNWEIRESKEGVIVRFKGETPGRWWEWLFDMDRKLEDLFENQWIAFANFSVGYMTAKEYEKIKAKGKDAARKHVRKAKSKLNSGTKKKRR